MDVRTRKYPGKGGVFKKFFQRKKMIIFKKNKKKIDTPLSFGTFSRPFTTIILLYIYNNIYISVEIPTSLKLFYLNFQKILIDMKAKKMDMKQEKVDMKAKKMDMKKNFTSIFMSTSNSKYNSHFF